MTRDDLEAAIRRTLTMRDRTRQALADAYGTRDNVFVDAILCAADAYALYTGGITAERRQVLEDAQRKEATPC